MSLTFLASLTYDTGFDQELEINILSKVNLQSGHVPSPDILDMERRLMFPVDSCEVLKKLKKENKNSNILKEINGLGSILFPRKWANMIDKVWYGWMTKSKYTGLENKSKYTDDVYGLLRIIGSINNHLLEAEWEE
ncbi:hypothetical protein Tco_0213266 [Tanacetum coccineum]